jgi:hypothetical protein
MVAIAVAGLTLGEAVEDEALLLRIEVRNERILISNIQL